MAMFAFSRRLSRKFSRTFSIFHHHYFRKESEVDDIEVRVVRYKPEGLDALCRNTRFSRRELQIMYRGFKQECPSGIVNEATFKAIYAQFFPMGDSGAYANFVFRTFDQDHKGSLSFEDFVRGLSTLARGSFHEKLHWTFTLYDINGDGVITREEMYEIVSSVYSMLGKFVEPEIDEKTTRNHVDQIFQRMDQNDDGVITVEEFEDSCNQDELILQSMAVFDTVL